jgi:hypothetical protein
MGRFLFGFLLLLTCASKCCATGAVAQGRVGNELSFFTSHDQRNYTDAQIDALQQCRARGFTNCSIDRVFQNTCIAITTSPAGDERIGFGTNADEARTRSLTTCVAEPQTACRPPVVACDRTPAPPAAANAPAPEPNQDEASPKMGFSLGDPFSRGFKISIFSAGLAGLIVSIRLLWTFASFFSTTPTAVVKRKVAVTAWICTPAAVTFLLWLSFPGVLGKVTFFHLALLFLWTNVFAALSIGGTLRRLLLPRSRTPDTLSLPLATLTFAIFTAPAIYLFIEYGLFANPGKCASPSPLFSPCDLYERQEEYFGLAVLLLLTLVGVALPANSNLILAYDRLTPKPLSSFGRRRYPLVHSDLPEHAAPEGQPARPAKEGVAEMSPSLANPIPDRTEEPQLDKRAVQEAFQRKRQQFDL